MPLRRRSVLSRLAPIVLIAVGLLPVAAAAGRYAPKPASDAVIVPVGGKDYIQLGADPLLVALVGPGTLSGYARAGFAPDETAPLSGALVFDGAGPRTISIPLRFKPSRSARWDDGRAGRPSGGRKFEVAVPDGVWTVRLTGRVEGGGLLVALLNYDGPPQPRAVTRARSSTKKKSPWRTRGSAGLEVIYDDNVLTQGDESIDAFVDGLSPDDFRIASYDDIVIAPSLDVSAERRLLSWGKTRFRFRTKRWMYARNPIKTNTDLHWSARQYWGSRASIELYYHYAPEQYIRQLGDRAPSEDESSSKGFRFTRNVANVTWRHAPTRKLSYTLIVETNRRYYNQPFIENDIEAWEVRGSVSYRLHKRFRLSADSSYEDAEARGYDTVGETAATSDDGDASYRRDLYRLGFDLKAPWGRPAFDSIDGSVLFMDYYYTTDKDLFDDPFHVGRRDKVTKVSLRVKRKINRALTVYGSFRYSQRVVESPWYGDITLDKDYIQHRWWAGMTYSF